MSRLRLLLANGDLLKLVLLRASALGAFQITTLAVSWQVYLLTGDAFYLGLIGLSQFLPVLLFAPLSGTLADRMDRRVLSCSASLLGAVATVALLAMSWLGALQFWSIVLISMAIASGRAFAFPAQVSLVPMIVERDALSGAIALGSSVNKMAMIIGPALGGLLLTLGPEANYAVAVVMLIASAGLAVSIRLRSVNGGQRRQVSLVEMVEGLPFIARRPVLLGVMSLDLFATLLGGATALLPYYVKDVLHEGPMAFGLLRAAPAIGAIMTAILLVNYPVNRWAGKAMLLGTVIYGAGIVTFGLSHYLWLSVVALMVTGMADFVSVIVRQSIVQLMTPDEMRGRVSAVAVTFINASNTLGQFESGVVAAAIGPVGSVVSGGIGSILVGLLWWRRFPQIAQVDLDAPELVENALATDRKTIL